MKILAGLSQPSEGAVVLDGEAMRFKSRRDASLHGISFVQQHFSLIEDMTPEENLALGDPDGSPWFSKAEARRRLSEVAERYQISVSEQQPVSTLSVGERQRLELAIAMSMSRTRLLILDEPTAALGPAEFDVLKRLLHRFTSEGVAIAYITHRLSELEGLADEITVLRRGEVVWQGAPADTNLDELASHMVGSLPGKGPVKREWNRVGVKTRLVDVSDTNAEGTRVLNNVTFDVFGGEIVGIAGVAGNGQEYLARILARLAVPKSGTVEPIDISTAYIPEDRAGEGLAMGATISDNAISRRHRQLATRFIGWLSRKRIHAFVKSILDDFDLRVPSIEVETDTLSGGNQQRLVLARELEENPDLIIAHNPTRGLDVKSSGEVWRRLADARDRGAAVVVISPDLRDLIEGSDRIVVLYGGRLVGEVRADEATVDRVAPMMVGGSIS